jgi:hypothetical protein
VALVFLIPSPRFLSVCTRTLFHRSPGIYSMTYSLFLFFFGGVSIPFLWLLSGLAVFQVVCGGAWSAAVWGLWGGGGPTWEYC